MVKRFLTGTLMVALLVLASACGNSTDSTNMLSMPSSSKDFEGNGYEEVVDDLTEAGFTNVKPKALDDLITGWITKEGSVETISINGDSLFTTDDNFPNDAEIVVSYHSFKADPDKPSESATATAPDTSSVSAEPSSSQDAEKESLTVANNTDLAALLSTGDPFDLGKEFVEKYEGRTIEFDGNIATMANHGTYKTRYDILIYGGDFNDSRGPSFQFNDVNISDLNLTGSKVPDTIREGDNLHIIAKVAGYNTGGDLLLLDPISTEIR